MMELESLREKLDETDKVLEERFAERMQIIEQIGEYKRMHGLATLDRAREAEVLAKHTAEQPEELKPYMEEFFTALMEISRRYQEDQKSREKAGSEASPPDIVIKKMESDDEIRGKAYVHWKCWHEAYPGLVSQDYLDRLTLEKCEKMAFSWLDNIIIAKDGDRVIGFIGYGDRGEEAPDTGEVFALYVLSEYYGKGVARQLMNAGLEQLKKYPQICLWVLKDNHRAIRFYQKCGFEPDGDEKMVSKVIDATEIRMVLKR